MIDKSRLCPYRYGMASVGTGYHSQCRLCGRRIKGVRYNRCKTCRDVESEKHMITQINYGTNGLNTLKQWAGVHAIVLKQSTQAVHHGDPMDLLDNRQTIEIPSLVMLSEEFYFPYTSAQVAAELQRMAEVCHSNPGCVVKWTRPATREQVDAAWKA